jgi:glycosyltransferase involved in cell wall biosynthesis
VLPEVDLIYTTAPSWSTHVVGLLLRRRTGKRWVADFRDPWLEIVHGRPDRPRTALTDRILHHLERNILHEADYVVAVAEKTRAALAAKVPAGQRSKFLLARNGIDAVHPPRHERVPGPLRVAYTGSFYDDRDPRLFLHALALLRTRRPLSPETLRVDFAGSCRMMNGFSVEHLVSELGLDDVVHFHDWMPRPDVQRMLSESDLLLVLARGMELQVPNKLYEYLGMRLPIFAWADEAGETAAVLRSIEGHYVVTSADVEEMARTLERALDAPPRAIVSPVQERILEEWNAERQMTRLVEAVGTAPAVRVA